MINITYPKISIVIPSYNQGLFIKETIDSVLNQKYPNLELIIIDGNSTDSTISILESYGRKIKWISEKDSGQTEAINKGLKMASGDILTYLNSDDCYLPGSLLAVSNFFNTHNNVYWVTGDYIIINEKGHRIQPYICWYKRILRKFHSPFMLYFANFIIQPSTFWKKTVTLRVGFFNESLKYVMDYDYWLRIINKYPLYVINKSLSAFRIHSSSKGGSQFKNQFNEELSVVLKYSKKRFIFFLHYCHNKLIIFIYNFIKRQFR